MKLSVGCTLAYDVLSPTANFTFNILVNQGAHQQVLDEGIRLSPDVPIGERAATSKGNRVFRIEAPTGALTVSYRALVEVTRPAMPAEVKADNPARLPLSILTYMLPSRYCESDRFGQMAWDLFGKIPGRAEQVREVCRWVDATIAYTPGATDSHTSAWDVWQLKKGVCRDYTHLSIALCRALSIPARYVGGYALGLDPMDFHACFEAYLGGAWYLFDPTDGIAPDRVAIIARGRDAANAPLTTIFGRVNAQPVKVTCMEVAEPKEAGEAAVQVAVEAKPAVSGVVAVAATSATPAVGVDAVAAAPAETKEPSKEQTPVSPNPDL